MFLFWVLMPQGQIYCAGTSCPRVRFKDEHADNFIGQCWKRTNLLALSGNLRSTEKTFIISKDKGNAFVNNSKNILKPLYRPAGTLHAGGADILHAGSFYDRMLLPSNTRFTILSFTRAPRAWLFYDYAIYSLEVKLFSNTYVLSENPLVKYSTLFTHFQWKYLENTNISMKIFGAKTSFGTAQLKIFLAKGTLAPSLFFSQ